MSTNHVPTIANFAAADQCDLELALIWDLMINGTANVLITHRSTECLELFHWLYEAHKHAVALYMFLFRQPIIDTVKLQRARHFISAFSALLETQYPFLTIKYKKMLSNADLLEVINAKMAVQYTAQVLGPDPVESPVHVMG